jgi:hypothetical protein
MNPFDVVRWQLENKMPITYNSHLYAPSNYPRLRVCNCIECDGLCGYPELRPPPAAKIEEVKLGFFANLLSKIPFLGGGAKKQPTPEKKEGPGFLEKLKGLPKGTKIIIGVLGLLLLLAIASVCIWAFVFKPKYERANLASQTCFDYPYPNASPPPAKVLSSRYARPQVQSPSPPASQGYYPPSAYPPPPSSPPAYAPPPAAASVTPPTPRPTQFCYAVPPTPKGTTPSAPGSSPWWPFLYVPGTGWVMTGSGSGSGVKVAMEAEVERRFVIRGATNGSVVTGIE